MTVSEYTCTVKSNRMITPTVFHLAFQTNKPLSFKGGQFISIIVPGAGPKGRDLRRAYSIASAPEGKEIELCIKLVDGGPGTNYLHNLKAGDTLRGFAPYGDFVYEPRAGRHAVFIATGTGIAPFRGMILSKEFKEHPPASAICLLGVRTADEVLYEKELSAVAPSVKYVSAVSQPTANWTGFKGRVTDYIRSLPADFPFLETEYYLCGNGAMITEIRSILAEKGVQKDAIHQEKYY